jgi:glutathione S-transferase
MVRSESESESERMGEVVTCVDFWANGYGMRVRIALREMQIGFDYIEEDFRNQETGQLVLDMNPIYRFSPILLHHGRPICLSKNML